METEAPSSRRASQNYTQWSDAELVVAALLSDLRAFDELTQRYRAAVIATALPFVNGRTAAEDLAQEVFLTAFYALPQLDDPACFGGWLRVMTKRKAWRLGSQEKAKTGNNVPLLEEALGTPHASEFDEPEASLEQTEEREQLWAALHTISVEQREILLLYAYEDWSLAQIAQYLSIEEGTARVRLFRARQALRRAWETLREDLDDASEKKEITRGKGRTTNERATKKRTETAAALAGPDVQGRRAREPDRSLRRGGHRNHQPLQHDSLPLEQSGDRYELSVCSAAGRCFA